MHVLMVTDAYPPMRTSCAVQMHDLAQAFIEEGHQVTVITPDSTLKENIRITQQDGVRLVEVSAFETKDINYVSRTLAELINPFLIWNKLKKSPEFLNAQYDGIIWYSPTIFWGPLIKRLKRQFKVKTYLILRDIFPDWALDLGLIKKGMIYQFLKMVERYQYKQADVIGLQSPNSLAYFKKKNPKLTMHTEVLWNWMGEQDNINSSIQIENTKLAGRKIFIYAGNMGKAQGIERFLDLARKMNSKTDVGFIFVGRGSEVENLKNYAKKFHLGNTLFFDEIQPAEIANLLNQCEVGLIALDERHNTHNIPGKFLAYLKSSLLILAQVNKDNDLIEIVKNNELGCINAEFEASNLYDLATQLLQLSRTSDFIDRCNLVFTRLFLASSKVDQITRWFKN